MKASTSAKPSNLKQARYKKTKATLVGSVCVLAFVASTAFASPYRVASVEGNKRVDAATVLSYAELEPGQTVNDAQIDEAYQKIMASGLFQSVRMISRGGQLVIKVEEYPTINKISFEGNRRVKDDDLKGFIESAPRQVYSATKAERDAQVIAQAYEQNGRIAARVTPRIIRRSENRVDLVFEIFEGTQIEIQRIGFVGNRAYSDRRLRRVIESKQAGLLRFLIKSDTFVEDRIEFDKQLLTDFYNSRGYVDFRILGVNGQLSEEQDTYFVTFNIQEGQQFHFGNITTVSDRTDVNVEDFQEIINVRPGKVYSPARVDRQIERMEKLAIKKGIDFLRIEPRITRNERDQTLDVQFVLSRGPRVFVERIDIEGNTTTLDRVIRRQFEIAEGDPFNPREIRAAADRIRALGYFKNVDVNATEGTSPSDVIVHTQIEETTTGSVTFGVGYSTNGGVGVNLGFSERNFLGRGQFIAADINATKDAAGFNFSFVEPAFLSRDVAFGIDLGYYETDRDYTEFDTRLGRFKPSIEFPISEIGRLQLYYDLEYQDMRDYHGDSGILDYEVGRGSEWLSSFGYEFTFDTQKESLDPNTGVVLSFGQQIAGAGGDLKFVQSTAGIYAQTMVFSEEVTLRASIKGGAYHRLGGRDIRAINRYTDQIIRGFEPNGMGPVEAGERLGGNYFVAAKFEALFPIGLPDEFGITGGAYYDTGSIWHVKKDHAWGRIHSNDFSLRHVVGASLFWKSPFGPLRMNFSKPLKKRSTDRTQWFDLTVSTEF